MKVREISGVNMDDLMIRTMWQKDLTSILDEIEPGAEALHQRTEDVRFRYGPAFTFLYRGEIIACAGVTIYWKGMGEVWLATSKIWKSMVKVAVIWTRDVLDYFQDNWHLWRLQADIPEENEVSRRFIEHYGFVAESKMRMYDSLGRDTIRYARIREEWNAQPC